MFRQLSLVFLRLLVLLHHTVNITDCVKRTIYMCFKQNNQSNEILHNRVNTYYYTVASKKYMKSSVATLPDTTDNY